MCRPRKENVRTGDFNGDTKGDLLWQDNSGNVAIWETQRTAVLNEDSSFVANVPGQWSIKGTGDFNGDGKTDILWQDSSGNVAIWEMNGTTVQPIRTRSSAQVPSQWTIKGTGDFNGDGKADILWQDFFRQCRDLGDERHHSVETRATRSSPTSPAAYGRSSSPATTTAMASAKSCGRTPPAMWRSGR